MNHWVIFTLGVMAGAILDAVVLGLAIAFFKGAAKNENRWTVDAMKILFGKDSSKLLTAGECHAICDWILCKKVQDQWIPSARAIEEYKILMADGGPLLNGAAA